MSSHDFPSARAAAAFATYGNSSRTNSGSMAHFPVSVQMITELETGEVKCGSGKIGRGSGQKRTENLAVYRDVEELRFWQFRVTVICRFGINNCELCPPQL